MKHLCRAVSELARYLQLNLFPERLLLNPSGQKMTRVQPHHCVVSLTTIPARIHRISPTIRSILTQTVKPNVIYLNIPHISKRQNQTYRIPQTIQALDEVRLLRTEQDWGPATKLLPLLQQGLSPDTPIIVIDDDQIYPRRLVETYLYYAHQYSNAALCLAGWQVPPDFCHQQRIPVEGARTRLIDRPANVLEFPQFVDIIQGASSYLVRPRFFEHTIFNYNTAPSAAFFVDDIWISGHLAKNKISRLVIPGSFTYARIQSLTSFRTLSLCKAEYKNGQNNQILYRFFQQDW